MYMALTPLGLEFGEDCLHFINSTVCFLPVVPYILPPAVVVEPIQSFSISAPADFGGGCQQSAPWHLARLNNVDTKGSKYAYDDDGSGVDVYVLDTWTDCAHEQFGGRCRELRRFAVHNPNGKPDHGTHVSGLVGSQKYGAAKRAQIKSVVVLDDQGYGMYDDWLKALEYVVNQIRQGGPKKRAIINMSLKGGRSRILDQVVEEIYENNIAIPVVAAGNEDMDACQLSPNSRKIPIVGATNIQNQMSQFSNYGRCVSISAPGESIASLCPQNKECWMSGTSMATPIVSGALAAFWDKHPEWRAQDTWREFRRQSVEKKIRVKKDTTSLFAQLRTKHQCLLLSGGGNDLGFNNGWLLIQQ